MAKRIFLKSSKYSQTCVQRPPWDPKIVAVVAWFAFRCHSNNTWHSKIRGVWVGVKEQCHQMSHGKVDKVGPKSVLFKWPMIFDLHGFAKEFVSKEKFYFRMECSGSCQMDSTNCNVFFFDNNSGICRLANMNRRLNIIGVQSMDLPGYVELSKALFSLQTLTTIFQIFFKIAN